MIKIVCAVLAIFFMGVSATFAQDIAINRNKFRLRPDPKEVLIVILSFFMCIWMVFIVSVG